MKKDDIVTFKNPNPDERREDGTPIPMRVREMRPSNGPDDPAPTRVLIEVIPDGPPRPFRIIPTGVYLESELQRVFKEFITIAVPSFLDAPAWIDASWGNDAAPYMRLDLPKKCPYELQVWVNYDDPAEREVWKDSKFCVMVVEAANGDEVDGWDGNSEAECLDAIEHFQQMITTLEANRKANRK